MAYKLSPTRVEWMWKSNEDPWNSSQKEDWRSYSDVETAIIEEAYQKKLSEALIDDYHINFKNSVQISNSNERNQRPVKRIERGRSTFEPRLREARFMPSPIHPSTPFAEQKFFLGFIGVIFEMFDVNDSNALAEPANRRLMIKKAAEGIITEGANLSDDLIEKFRQNIGAYLMFPAFTSPSRNRAKAEQFGNVIFIIHTSSLSGNNVASFSDYPDEEETLLNADFNFYIRSCTFDTTKNKWIINISSWEDD
ncbi:unnamed protein product [Rotaria sp. Silwood1]|nr:unnamed protein product [Rotaria sp. Silwood1]